MLAEFKTRTFRRSFIESSRAIGGIIFQQLLVFVLFAYRGSIGGFDSVKYVKSIATNSDFQKFDDVLRMILDCSPAEREEILKVLDSERAKGRVAYGVHIASSALMTCMVFNLEDHIHFIDGSGGGYALAARQLKEQLAERKAD